MNHTVTSESHPTSKPPVSERKAAANRANAKRSTGPRTPQGKARSSLNALRHGILAKAAFNLVIEGEERRAEFDTLVAGLAQEYQPRTMTEHMTVQQLAGCYWKLAKVWHCEQERAFCEWNSYDGSEEGHGCNENNVFQKMADMDKARADGEFLRRAGLVAPTIPDASANTILRYQGAIQSMITRCLTILERRRKERMAEHKTSGDAFEELDYINEPTGAAPSDGERPAPAEKHKRTQNDAPNAQVSSEQPQEEATGTAKSAPPSAKNREATA